MMLVRIVINWFGGYQVHSCSGFVFAGMIHATETLHTQGRLNVITQNDEKQSARRRR